MKVLEIRLTNLLKGVFTDMLRIGLSSNGFTHDDEFFSGVINAGITDIEISRSYYDELIGFNFNNVMKLSAKHGVNICSFHLPFAQRS